jgi:hypothetical protein
MGTEDDFGCGDVIEAAAEELRQAKRLARLYVEDPAGQPGRLKLALAYLAEAVRRNEDTDEALADVLNEQLWDCVRWIAASASKALLQRLREEERYREKTKAKEEDKDDDSHLQTC